jgi:Arc/MetJ-type ribon-helix-helix transcriptional regulator
LSVIEDAVHCGQYHSAVDVLTEAVALWQTQKAGVIAAGEERREALDRLKTFGKRHVSRSAA